MAVLLDLLLTDPPPVTMLPPAQRGGCQTAVVSRHAWSAAPASLALPDPPEALCSSTLWLTAPQAPAEQDQLLLVCRQCTCIAPTVCTQLPVKRHKTIKH